MQTHTLSLSAKYWPQRLTHKNTGVNNRQGLHGGREGGTGQDTGHTHTHTNNIQVDGKASLTHTLSSLAFLPLGVKSLGALMGGWHE